MVNKEDRFATTGAMKERRYEKGANRAATGGGIEAAD